MYIYSPRTKKQRTKQITMYSASASANIKSANTSISISITSDNIEDCVSVLEKVVGRSFSSDHGDDIDGHEEMHNAEEKHDTEEKPKKNYVSGWLLFRRDRGPQAKKVLEKLRIVASGPNLVKVLSAMWAEIGEEQRAKWNEKAKAIRSETAL